MSAFAAARAYRDESKDASSDSDLDENNASAAEARDQDESLVLVTADEELSDRGSSDFEQTSSATSRVPAQPHTVELSTWVPSPTNVSREAQITRLHLNLGETATFIGQYDVEVKEGTVTVCEAILSADGTSHHVFAPTTHSLPSIKCLTKVAIIEFRPSEHMMQSLSKLTPLYRRIWNETRIGANPSPSQGALNRGSFSFVRRHSLESKQAD